jgi:hypothetical protein
LTGKFEPETFEDRYENAMIELIRSKQAGQPAPKEKPSAPPPNVVNLMDALRRSFEAGSGKGKPADKPAPAKSTARPRRKAANGDKNHPIQGFSDACMTVPSARTDGRRPSEVAPVRRFAGVTRIPMQTG